ncbi:hypothetical protein T484DRAFT_1817128 [Baffinella frigidus]|nr:hypothetical protein T484DRAFT_1817128 [Cryptophyta sp. CCMP2293]
MAEAAWVGLRQLWRRLLSLGQERNLKLAQLQERNLKLAQLQAGFKRDVAKSAKSLALEVMQFCNDFDMNGPMLSGLAPPETMERLHKYQTMYDKREEEPAMHDKREEEV